MSEPVRRLMLAQLVDALAVYQGRAAVRGSDYEAERTWTYAWFFAPERYSPGDPLSFENICATLHLPASKIRRALKSGRRIKIPKGL